VLAYYRPIPIIIYLFSVLIIESSSLTSQPHYEIQQNLIVQLTTVLQSVHGNKFKLSLHFPVSKVYHQFLLKNCCCYHSTNWRKTINRYRRIISQGTDNRPKQYRVISIINAILLQCYYGWVLRLYCLL